MLCWFFGRAKVAIENEQSRRKIAASIHFTYKMSAVDKQRRRFEVYFNAFGMIVVLDL